MITCTDWEDLDCVETTCPYCEIAGIYYGGYAEGDKVQCDNCQKKFKLGEQE